MKRQSTASILMVSPDHFGFNTQTSGTNPFQHTPQSLHKSSQEIRDAAQAEFLQMIEILRQNEITVFVLPSRKDVITPDAVFPNNWFSYHKDGKLVLYPMLTANRRLERQTIAIKRLFKKSGIVISQIIDLTKDEEKGLILESTGSMILERPHKIAFAMASPRTVKEEFEKWCRVMEFEGIFISSTKYHEKETYHTNLHMSIGSDFAVVCLEAIENNLEKKTVQQKLQALKKEIIEISLEQVHQFCGNILEVQSKSGNKIVVMSQTAHKAFTKKQLSKLEKYCKIVAIGIPIIEEVGGGGVRCMMAEIFY